MTRRRRLSRSLPYFASHAASALLLVAILAFVSGCGGKADSSADTAGASAATAADGSALLTPLAFRERFVERLRDAHPDYIVTPVSPTELHITIGKDQEYTSFLDNAYQGYTQAPEDLDTLLDIHIGVIAENAGRSEDATIDIANVVPIIKSTAYLADMQKLIASRNSKDKPGQELYAFPLNDELVILLAENTEASLRYLSVADVGALPVQDGELQVRSVKNLLPLFDNLQIANREGIYFMAAGGNFEASLILVTGLWTPEYMKVEGDYVMAVPARDLVLVTGSAETQKVDALRIVAQRLYEESTYPISPSLFVKREGGWELLPAADAAKGE